MLVDTTGHNIRRCKRYLNDKKIALVISILKRTLQHNPNKQFACDRLIVITLDISTNVLAYQTRRPVPARYAVALIVTR